jgi:hypothetical protein
MIRAISFVAVLFLFSCASNKKTKSVNELPSCVLAKIKMMAADSTQGSPESVTCYHYKGKTVYYFLSSCCDKFNLLFDSCCNLLGYPDGGFTGRGDGKTPDVINEATDGKVVWKRN